MLSVVTFKWQSPTQPNSRNTAKHVNVLRRMVARHYQKPHRFICITDDAEGIDKEVETLPLWSDFGDMLSPHGPTYPSCYRRLRLFSKEIADLIGPRFVSLDLDCVIVRDVRPVWDRPEPIVLWGRTHPTTHYNGSMLLMTAGARAHVWKDFDPLRSPDRAKAAQQFGSDQGWISYKLGPNEPRWSTADGVYSYRKHIHPLRNKPLPIDARIVFFHGKQDDPAEHKAQQLQWVRAHWV